MSDLVSCHSCPATTRDIATAVEAGWGPPHYDVDQLTGIAKEIAGPRCPACLPSSLGAFMVGIPDEETGWIEPRVFAALSTEHAIYLAFPGDDWLIGRTIAGGSDYQAKPVPEFDHLIKRIGRIELTTEDERSAGWHFEGEASCSTCGLYPCGMDEFEVCPECDQCPDCGHSDDCTERDPEEE